MRVVLPAILFLSSVNLAAAQSLSPMRGEVRSFTDRFAVRVQVGNPYERNMKFDMTVYDKDFYPVPFSSIPSELTIAGGATRQVVIVVPFEGQRERRVRICVESVAYKGNSTRVRTQVCGKFLAHTYVQQQ